MDTTYTVRKFESEYGTLFFILPSKLALGVYHDVLMKEKGWAVDKMIAAQQEEEKMAAEHQKKSDDSSEEKKEE